MKFENHIVLTSLLMITFFLSTCTKDKTPVPIEPCDPNQVYFERDILPIINSNCAKSGCHDAATSAEGVNLSTYTGVMKTIKPRNPSSSKLVEAINGSGEEMMPPPPATPLTDQQKQLIVRWISEGALNVFCTMDSSSCSTGTVSFAQDVSSIININCFGCHSGSSPGGGISLDGYSAIKSVAISGKLYNSTAQNGQSIPMPPSAKLQPCDIKKIKGWLDAGSPNN
jgi:uncharacterized membrane protein